jgi:hypothetical protein
MQQTLEKNGKPCCMMLITDSDAKFMETLAKAKRIKDNTAELAKIEPQLADLATAIKES